MTASPHPSDRAQPATLWLDAGDLVVFLRLRDHVPAIQRVGIELMLALVRRHGARVRLCRINRFRDRLEPVAPEAIQRDVDRIIANGRPRGGRALVIWYVVNTLRRLALSLRDAARDLIGTDSLPIDATLAERSGDIMLNFTDSMLVRGYTTRVAAIKRRYGLQFGVLIHDIIPVTHPHFVHQDGHDRLFGRWLEGITLISDLIVVASAYNRDAIRHWSAQSGHRIPAHVQIIRFGSGFSSHQSAALSPPRELPKNFVLFVSTIEIRKNHQLLVRVWQALIERHGRDVIPDLVFVGRIGWKVDNLVAELRSTDHLDGKIHIVTGLSDAQVGEAYRKCLFTVFPSFCEGWGLPVAESLAQGAVCIASNGGSIPEVGGDLITYFDPHDIQEATAIIERAILDRDHLTAQTAKVQQQYQPSTWGACADALVDSMDRTR